MGPALPTDAAARKAAPVFSGVLKYFPRALAAVAALSRIGNEQHNPGKPMFWDRSKSSDELDALTRHLLEAGTLDTDGVPHSVKVVWRALANLEKEEEAREYQAAQQRASDELTRKLELIRAGVYADAEQRANAPIGEILQRSFARHAAEPVAEQFAEPGLYTVHGDGSVSVQPLAPLCSEPRLTPFAHSLDRL